MIKQKLGKIKQVDLKDVFEKEDKDFTPWLNENLNILGKKLNLDIIDSNIEESVGNFSCDIIARDSDSNKIIIIENQFGTTDHEHLGKILTYAAGKQAGVIIWIAENFREEHKKALEWLNENVDPEGGPSFFGIEIKLIKIEDSPPAPDFRIVVKPNDWERMIKISSQTMSETAKKYLKFYSKLVDEYKKINPRWRKVKPQPQSWLSFGAGKGGLSFVWAFKSNNRFAIELYIDTGDKNKNERIFEELEKHKDKIENEIKGLIWEKMEEKRACRIAIYKNIKGSIKYLSEEDYPEIIEWASRTMKEFSNVLSRYIKKI
ncbi:MAG: DUF4268 domain-containing protein [Thaumarchaeota archaeon]|nr:MAG: DUF4268 domain-containing protein [Nitrososphaerota archaeon]